MSSTPEFTSFKSAFNGDIVTSDEQDAAVYEASVARWAFSAAKRASIITFPRDASAVAQALRYAQTHELDLAVRGGGHSAAGYSATPGGLVIDLSRYFAGVRVDEEKQLGYVGGGAIWKTVDEEAIKYGLATVGGTVNHTGVGGLTLGGGYGHLSGMHGLAVDNLVQATIVTAAGETLLASDSSNPDLFYAIRGGGGNFGIATELVFKLHPQRKTVFGGVIAFAPPSLEDILSAVAARVNDHRPKESIHMAYALGPDKKPCILMAMFFNGSEDEGKEAFKDIFAIGPVANHTGEIPYEKVNSFINEQVGFGNHFYMTGTGITTVRPDVHKAVWAAYLQATDLLVATDPSFNLIVITELTDTVKLMEVPRGTMAFNSRGPQKSIVILAAWEPTSGEQPGSDSPHLPLVRKLAAQLKEIFSKDESISDDENNLYGNYDSEPSNLDKVRRLFGSNYPKLQEIKKKYDPHGIFNKWQAIQPA